jgi:uncharacterized protein DUF4395
MTPEGAMRDSQIRFISQLGYRTPNVDNGWYGALMFQPRMIGVVVTIGVGVASPWVFLTLSSVLWWSTIVPKWNVFDAIYNGLVLRRRGLPPVPPAPAPRQFAQSMAATAAFVTGVALLEHAMMTAWLVEALFAVGVIAAVFKDFCGAAVVYTRIMRARRREISPLPC